MAEMDFKRRHDKIKAPSPPAISKLYSQILLLLPEIFLFVCYCVQFLFTLILVLFFLLLI